MNNNIICILVLFFTLPSIASEISKSIFDKEISAIVFVAPKAGKGEKSDRCVIIGKYDQLTIYDLSEKNDLLLKKKSEFDIDKIARERNGSFQIAGSSGMLAGTSTQDFKITIYIENKGDDAFQQRIKQCYDLYKKNQKNKDFFFVHLRAINPVDEKIISLKFTEHQVEQIIQKPLAISPILTGLCITGIIVALVYYFNLHSKYMRLLRRS